MRYIESGDGADIVVVADIVVHVVVVSLVVGIVTAVGIAMVVGAAVLEVVMAAHILACADFAVVHIVAHAAAVVVLAVDIGAPLVASLERSNFRKTCHLQ